jgi:hypothetical protein
MSRGDRAIEEEAGTGEGRERPRNLSAAYLEQAVSDLHAAGNPAVLYRGHRAPPPEDAREEKVKGDRATAFLLARYRHMTHCRNAVLFAALAAESYVNEFLAFFLTGQDLEAVDRMSPVSKYVLGTKLASGEALFKRDEPPIPDIAALFKLRDKLVHPKPGFGPAPFAEPWGEFEQNFPPPKVAKYIVAVASAAAILIERAYPEGLPDVWSDVISRGKDAIVGYGDRAANVPGQYDPPTPNLFREAIDAATTRAD